MPERVMTFRWDEDGNAHIQHDDDLTLKDAQEALASLACIVAHNVWLNEGDAGVRVLLGNFREAVYEYIGFAKSGVDDGSRIGVLRVVKVADNPSQEDVQ